MRRLRLLLAGLITLSAGLAACAPGLGDSARPSASPIPVGAIISLSGSQATGGQMAKEGYLFCQDWINAKGGIVVRGVGHPLNLDIVDDQSRPSIAATLTEQLISQGDKLLLGPSNDATTARAAPIAEQHGIPLLSSGASSETIFSNGYHYVFSVLSPASDVMHGVIDMAVAQNPKPQSVAILLSNDSLSTEVANAASAYAQSQGLNVAYAASYTLGVNNLSGPLAGAAGAAPDILLEVGHPDESVQTIQRAQQMNLQPKLLAFSSGPGTASFVSDLHKAANFSVGVTQWAPTAHNRISYFIDGFHYSLAYAAQFGHLPDEHAAAATAACLTLEVAIEEANSTIPRWVRDALGVIDLHTFFGEIKFDDRGINTAKPVYVEQIQAGQTVLVWPPDIASARPRYPDPGWAKH